MQSHRTLVDEVAQGGQRSARRQFVEHVQWAPNAHRYWWRVRNPIAIVFQYLVIHAAKHLPSLVVKRILFRSLGMKLRSNVTIASGVTLDYFFPELIEIGENSIVEMNAMILTHEFLSDRWRQGAVRIGSGVLIGANSTVLAGVSIGDGARISAGTLVNRNVPAHARAIGNPMQLLP